MNSQKYLILIKGEDKTDDIVCFDRENYYINVRYKNADKTYKYSQNVFKFFKEPNEIDINDNKIITRQGYYYNIVKALKFGKYYKIFLKNENAVLVDEKDISIVKKDDKTAKSSNMFDYFKEISKVVSIKTDEGEELLTKAYEGINFIENDTALYKYLNPTTVTNPENKVALENLIFPFRTNKSQIDAVQKALNNQISIIEGPPRNRKNSDNSQYYCKYCKNGKNSCSGLKQ